MSRQRRILVTGVGGDLGQAVVKALRLCESPIQCFGADVSNSCAGSLLVDSFYTLPLASSTIYMTALTELCDTLNINVVIPASVQEIEVLNRLSNPPKLPNGIPIVCHSAPWYETYGDKLSCMRRLEKIVPIAAYADGRNADDVKTFLKKTKFPVVVKERRSSGSRSLRIARNEDALKLHLNELTEPLLQEYVDDLSGEFSIGVFSYRSKHFLICFKRQLGFGGTSVTAETSNDSDVLDYAQKIARAVQGNGSFNIQVRKSRRGVHLLEINPRFSSLAAFRAACGFRDVEWSLDLAIDGTPPSPQSAFREGRFQRYLCELIDFGDGYSAVLEWQGKRLQCLQSTTS